LLLGEDCHGLGVVARRRLSRPCIVGLVVKPVGKPVRTSGLVSGGGNGVTARIEAPAKGESRRQQSLPVACRHHVSPRLDLCVDLVDGRNIR
jgi:hypothetical protein